MLQEKEMQKSKMTVRGGLTNSCEKTRSKKQRRKGKTVEYLNSEHKMPQYGSDLSVSKLLNWVLVVYEAG